MITRHDGVRIRKVLGVLFLLPAATDAAADADLSGSWAEISIEIESEYLRPEGEADNAVTDTAPSIGMEFGLASDQPAGVYGHLVFEPVRDTDTDRLAEDLGLYAEELYLFGEVADTLVTLGKFNPRFDIGSDLAPGLYGDELAGEYELTERIGAAVEFPFTLGYLENSLAVSVFMADRTPLSNSLFTERGRLTREDGGPSNTASPETFALSLGGEAGRTIYNLGVRNQKAGAEDEYDETGFVVGVGQGFGSEETETLVFAELARFRHFDGEAADATILTLAAETIVDAFAFSAAYGIQESNHEETSRIATATVGYEVAEDLFLELGYLYRDDGGEISHALAGQLTYEFSLGRD